MKTWFALGLLMVVLAAGLTACGRASNYEADWSAVSVPDGTFVTTAGSASEQALPPVSPHSFRVSVLPAWRWGQMYNMGARE